MTVKERKYLSVNVHVEISSGEPFQSQQLFSLFPHPARAVRIIAKTNSNDIPFFIMVPPSFIMNYEHGYSYAGCCSRCDPTSSCPVLQKGICCLSQNLLWIFGGQCIVYHSHDSNWVFECKADQYSPKQEIGITSMYSAKNRERNYSRFLFSSLVSMTASSSASF